VELGEPLFILQLVIYTWSADGACSTTITSHIHNFYSGLVHVSWELSTSAALSIIHGPRQSLWSPVVIACNWFMKFRRRLLAHARKDAEKAKHIFSWKGSKVSQSWERWTVRASFHLKIHYIHSTFQSDWTSAHHSGLQLRCGQWIQIWIVLLSHLSNSMQSELSTEQAELLRKPNLHKK